jgi:hypothetical protein
VTRRIAMFWLTVVVAITAAAWTIVAVQCGTPLIHGGGRAA